MFGIAFASALALVLAVAVRWSVPKTYRVPVLILLLVGYAARLTVCSFARDLPLFSHGVGGDWDWYERCAVVVAKLWDYSGIRYITADQYPPLHEVTLPANLFGAVVYLNGGRTQIGCTAVVALLACGTCLNVYVLSAELGARRDVAFRIMAAVLFAPSFFFYTADMFKDGMVQFCVVGIVAAAVRLSYRVSIAQAALAIVCMVGLWLSRFYLVYAVMSPFVIGVARIEAKATLRNVLAIAVVAGIIAAFAYGMRTANEFLDTAAMAFQHGTSDRVLRAVASGGSGVDIQGGSSAGSLGIKLVYTLFAPFPWQSGSLGFQLEKIECVGWYFIAARALMAASKLMRDARRPQLIVLLAFIVPTTVAYAAGFGNVGLIVRERLGVVLICAVLASLSWVRQQATSEHGAAESDGRGTAPASAYSSGKRLRGGSWSGAASPVVRLAERTSKSRDT